VQQLSRKVEIDVVTRQSFKKHKLMQNYAIEASNPNCLHDDTCGCRMTLKGLAGRLQGEIITSNAVTTTDQMRDILARVNARLVAIDPLVGTTAAEEELSYFHANFPKDANAKIVPPPYAEQPTWPQSIQHMDVEPSVRRYVFTSDAIVLNKRTGCVDPNALARCFNYDSTVPSLKTMCLRVASTTFQCFGLTNGRPHVISAMSDLYTDHKLTKAVLNMVRPTLHDRPLPSNLYEEEVARHFYRMSGIDFNRKEKVVFALTTLINMYLGSSNGRNRGAKFKRKYDEFTLVVRPKGKKIETFEQDLAALINMLRTGEIPAVYWSVTPKNERYYSWSKQYDDKAYAAWCAKLRLFIIPSSINILMEKLVSVPRMRREHGRVIRVGHRWPFGGGDTLANCLGVTDPFCPSLVAGDFQNFDLSVLAAELRDYWGGCPAYYDPNDEWFEILVAFCDVLAAHSDARMTNVIGALWAIFTGSVASGKYNTSHANSVVSSKEVIRFMLYQIHNAPKELRSKLFSAFVAYVKIVVYGDDHIYNKSTCPVASQYFSGQNFKNWCARFRGKTIRDMKDGISFCSRVLNGYIVEEGVTFLKHYFIENPYYGDKFYPGQCKYLPFRETREYMIRCVFSSEVKKREPLDVLLSIIGQVYATYASNRDAYDRLYALYATIIAGEGFTVESLQTELARRAEDKTMKKMRQMGLTIDIISNGFPSWDTLVKRNKYDPLYQDISHEFDTDMEYVLD